MTKKLKGKRTLLFATAAGLVPTLDAVRQIIEAFLATPEIGQIIPTQYYPFYALAVALGTFILRLLTSTPVGKSE